MSLRSMSLRVESHPRGHIAACNGRVELVNARVEQCADLSGDDKEVADATEAWGRAQRERKAERLHRFQREVRARVRERERARQQQAVASEAAQQEQDRGCTKDGPSWSVGAPVDVEDVRVVCGATQGPTPHLSQAARRSMLALRGGVTELRRGHHYSEQQCIPETHQITQQTSTFTQSENTHITDDVVGSMHLQHSTDARSSSQPIQREPSAMMRFTPEGRLKHNQHKQAGLQFMVFRRLYSELEREKVRQRRAEQAHSRRVLGMKGEKEAERRLVEGEVNAMDSFSTVSTETAEDQQRAREWAELMALEQRRQQLQRARENERYINALKERVRERLAQRQASIPPLCSCGTSVWDTSPETCANNCVFYKNPKAYAKALSSLLLSLES